MTRLSAHELTVLRHFRRLRSHPSAGERLLAPLRTVAGNFAVNTPLFLLPARINLRPRHRVLEIGCGSGASLRFLASRVRFHRPPVGIDLDADGIQDRSGQSFVRLAASGTRLPFADRSFDFVFAGHVVRHLSGEGFLRLLVEAYRVLRPGGVLALWDYAKPEGGSWGRLSGWFADRMGGRGTPRDFAALAHWASEANFDAIENPELRPFLFPPVRHVSLLARRPPRDPTGAT